MSLIADALKAAQNQRGKPDVMAAERRMHVLLDSSAGSGVRLSVPRRGAAPANRPHLRLVVLALCLAPLLIGGAVAFSTETLRTPPVNERESTTLASVATTTRPDRDDTQSVAKATTSNETRSPGVPERVSAAPAAVPSRRAPASSMDRTHPASSLGEPAAMPAPTSSAADVNPAREIAGGPPAETSSRGFSLSMDAPPETVSRMLDRAMAAQQRGDPETALELYRRVIDGGNGSAEIYNNIGAAYRALNDLPRARLAYRKALELNPRYAAAWSNLGVVYDAQQDRPNARAAFQEALRLDPGNTGAKVNLALQLRSIGMRGEAERMLREVVATEPLLPEAHYALATVLQDGAAAAEAAQHFRLFLRYADGRFPGWEDRVRRHLATLPEAKP